MLVLNPKKFIDTKVSSFISNFVSSSSSGVAIILSPTFSIDDSTNFVKYPSSFWVHTPRFTEPFKLIVLIVL